MLVAILPTTPRIWSLLDPTSACLGVPPLNPSNTSNAKIEILSPANLGHIDGIEPIVPIQLKLTNFDLHKDQNRIVLFLDKKLVQASFFESGFMLDPNAAANSDGNLHDYCFLLINGTSNAEVARAGIRFSVKLRGPDAVDFVPFIQFCCIASLLILVLIAIVFGAKSKIFNQTHQQ